MKRKKKLKKRIKKLEKELLHYKQWHVSQEALDDICNRPNSRRVIATERGEYYEPQSDYPMPW